jgi:transcriptional regulator with XRE-family HTH domain|tara:strand:+ start:56 stop:265 length:210 start_codon:yes stop_codon:yes gene_type:complete
MAKKPTLAQRMAELRKSRGFSQAELARRTGFDPSFISQLESGKRKGSSYATLQALANALDVEVNQLLGM